MDVVVVTTVETDVVAVSTVTVLSGVVLVDLTIRVHVLTFVVVAVIVFVLRPP